MSVKVIISMDVDNYDNWLTIFNSEGPRNARSEAGLTVAGYRNQDDPNNVVVIGTAPSKEEFLEFFTSAKQKERMQSAGVISKPTIIFLEN